MTSQHGTNRRRGQPLVALALLITTWTGMRMLLWHSPFSSALASVPAAPAISVAPRLARLSREGPDPTRVVNVSGGPFTPPPMAVHVILADPMALPSNLWPKPVTQVEVPALSDKQSPSAPGELTASPALVPPGVPPPPAKPGRWHLASWLAWREGSGLPERADGPRPASYGGTQAGVIARFDLGPAGHRPALHVRATYAPDRPRQAEIAGGASLRPLPSLPLRLMAEARATRSQDRTELRPAVLAVTEFERIALPWGLTAEGYGQAGWVGGRYATAFADGQARVTGEVASTGHAQVHLGAGAWGGAQKFAERVDVGPTVGVNFDAGPVVARVAIDYRIRIAGTAIPGDGVALTLSTGF